MKLSAAVWEGSESSVEGVGSREANQEEVYRTRKVDVRLPERRNVKSHGARLIHQIISTIKCIRTSRLPIKKSLSSTKLNTTLFAGSHNV